MSNPKELVDETALKALIRSGVEHNLATAKPAKARKGKA